jgi:sulfite exporter TauE/SafE
VISWLLLGFTMGLRHALEADHLAAVASLSARAASPAALMRVAGAWGVGHGLTIVAIACLWVATGVTVPEQAQPFVEAAAGLLLVWLGIDLLRTRAAGRARLAVHEHRGGTVHAHLHFRTGSDPSKELTHPHAPEPMRRALFVGAIHGLGGSALLGLLAARGVHASQAIAYAVVFGLGATAGMLLLSTTVSIPLRRPGVRAAALGRTSRRAVGLASIAVGGWIGARALMQLEPSLFGIS